MAILINAEDISESEVWSTIVDADKNGTVLSSAGGLTDAILGIIYSQEIIDPGSDIEFLINDLEIVYGDPVGYEALWEESICKLRALDHEFKNKTRWIPCEEGLPEGDKYGQSKRVLVSTKDGVYIAEHYYKDPPFTNKRTPGEWYVSESEEGYMFSLDEVDAWMPLPGEYKGGAK